MLEKLLKLYTVSMATGVTSPMPHVVGPPGAGKSTVFQQLADLLGVRLHVVNVSRISPLGLEGLEMPDETNSALRLLVSELWTKAQPGDIYLFDEFLRGFPEVYNGLLDIFTGREVAGYELPQVFIAGASNSTATYDRALEDRLLHIPVADPRRSSEERTRLAQLIVDELGLDPRVQDVAEMFNLLENEVLPTYDMLDSFGKKGAKNSSGGSGEGSSVRKLIGQAKLREVQSSYLRKLLQVNNQLASQPGREHHMFLYSVAAPPAGYEERARALLDVGQLEEPFRTNTQINLQMIGLYETGRNLGKDKANDAFPDVG